MAKITMIFTDVDGRPEIELITDPTFEGDAENLTPAQHCAMIALSAIADECEILQEEESTIQ